MKKQEFATEFAITFLVDRTPEEVFAAINDVRRWWSGEIEGDRVGAEFTYRYSSVHRSRQKITTLDPDRKVVWHVVDSHMSFLEQMSEWTGTDIVFELSRKGGKTEVRFAHKGLAPEIECFDNCSNAWAISSTATCAS